MKLYVAPGPNSYRVRIFMAEKGITLPMVELDYAKREHKSEEFLKLNSLGQVPVLVLDDGTVITESVAICRYLEALHPSPPLFGSDAARKGLVEMWSRRVEIGLLQAVAHAFRHLHPKMAALEVPQIAAWGEANKEKAAEMLVLLDRQLAAAPFVAGDAYSIADITALVAVDFMRPARIPMPEGLDHVARWHRDVAARPSYRA